MEIKDKIRETCQLWNVKSQKLQTKQRDTTWKDGMKKTQQKKKEKLNHKGVDDHK